MKNVWPIKELADVADSISTGPFGTMLHKADYVSDGIPLVNPVNMIDGQIVPSGKMMINEETRNRLSPYVLRTGDVVVARRGELGRCALVTKKENGWLCGTGSCFIRLSKEVDERFFVMLFGSSRFREILEGLSVGTTMSNLNHGILKNLPVPVPPLAEQRRIVGILDEAFEGIATAKANAEKNLQNARALFESHLQSVFTQRGEGWVEKPLSECFRLKSGDGLTSKAMKDGAYPVFGGNGIAGMHDEFNLSGDNVIVGRVGALCGNARHITEEIWLTDNAFKIVDFCDPFDGAFLTYLLNYKNLRSLARQAAQPVISNSSLKDLVLNFPGLVEQRRITDQLDALSEETQRLESIYRRKLAAIDDLKRSLLHQAFSGGL